MEEDPFDPQGLFSRPPSQPSVAPSTSFPPANAPTFSFQPPQNGVQQPLTTSTTFPSNSIPNKPIPPVPQKPQGKPTVNYNVTIDDISTPPSLSVPNTIGRSNSNPGTVTSNPMPTMGQVEPPRLQPMPSISSLSQPTPIQNSSSDVSAFSYDKAAELIQAGYQRLEKGMFLEALEAVNQSIKILGKNFLF